MCFVKFVGGALANRADSDLVEIVDLQSASYETLEKKFDTIGAGEDEPVVAVEMVEGFVEPIVVFELTDFDRWARDDGGAVILEQRRQLFRLRRRARNNNRPSLEWFHNGRFTGVIV